MRRRNEPSVPLYHFVLAGLIAVVFHFTSLRIADLLSAWIERAAGVRIQQGQAEKQEVSSASANTAEGRDTGSSATWGHVIAAVGVVGVLGTMTLMALGILVTVGIYLATR